MIVTDTHTHLYAREFDTDRHKLMDMAIGQGITRFFLPNIDSSSIVPMMNLAHEYPEVCYPMMGLHPCSVKENYKEELDKIEKWLDKQKFHAIGEIGIDLHWDKTFYKEQQDAFITQVGFARAMNLPIVIHTRNSFNETATLLEDFIKKDPSIGNPLKGIFHCFGGTKEDAQRVIDMGFKMGIGGVLTFKNSELASVVKEIDIEHFVLETDAPYLAPTPFRGKRNEPEFLLLVLKAMADLKEITMEEAAQITTFNSIEVFGI